MLQQEAARWWRLASVSNAALLEMLGDQLDSPSVPDDTMRGLFVRAYMWTRTIEQLAGPAHHQALQAGLRAALEVAVDMTLLEGDRTLESFAILRDWELSAKLKAARRSVKYSEKIGAAPDANHLAFIAKWEPEHNALRVRRNWLKGHPSRWTGRALDADCVAADRLLDPEVKELLGVGFEETYASLYDTMCWNTHGSTLTAMRGADQDRFHAYVGQSYALVPLFAIHCGMLLLRHSGHAELARAGLDMVQKRRFEVSLAEQELNEDLTSD